MLQTFLDQASSFLAQSDGLMAQKSIADVGRLAHKLRSSVGIFGMQRLLSTLELLEVGCKASTHSESITILYRTVKQQLLLAISELEAEKQHYRERNSC